MTTNRWKEEKRVPLSNDEGVEGSNWEDVTIEYLGATLDDGYYVLNVISVEIHPKMVLH